MNNIKELVEKELQGNDIESLEKLAEWWMEYEYVGDPWESALEYERRKEMVMPMIMNEKLLRYEQEYFE
jgi:hypothetical protein